MSLTTLQKEILKRRNGRALNFICALAIIQAGGKVMRISWNEENSYLFYANGLLLHKNPFHKNQVKLEIGYPYVMSDSDIYANDWICIK